MQDFETFKKDVLLLDLEIKTYYNGLDPKKRKPIYDGIVNIEEYYFSPLKILWILKEPYDKENQGECEWNLAELLGTEGFLNKIGGARSTWHPIIYTTYAILHNIPFDGMSFIKDEPGMANILKKIAFINVHKFPAGTTSVNSEISAAYRRDKVILLKQIETYKPDIVIGGNVMWNFVEDLGLTGYGGYDEYDYWIKNNRLYINANHPAAPKNDEGKEAYVDDIFRIVQLFNKKKTTPPVIPPLL